VKLFSFVKSVHSGSDKLSARLIQKIYVPFHWGGDIFSISNGGPLSSRLRLPELMISELKQLAYKCDVLYQSLMKVFLAERIQEVLKQNHSAS
jgi:hypothetical protein